ncbi:MAG: chromosome segregation protein SMC [Pseudohongiellaceae bacterium]
MRLKCIKLAGFKSFVDPTTIEFPSNLCAVVGPNGCGKSNVIDAVRWVMGESSAKNLRGEQMTDVIFNGSGGRKPVGQASIELIFDNHDHKLTGEYANFTEVSIRRKVDRDSVSSYYLNGTRCRRRDITDIFLGTGLGARSYSIIEQGMISQLIESKPEELRVFIEEAAGISKYKERRRETENRIKRTRENLERLADIRAELERQLQTLKRQAHAAEKYGELKQQERDAQANLNALRWRSLDTIIRENQTTIGQQEVQVEARIAEQRKLDASIEQHRADNAELTDAFGKVQARYYALGNDIARIEQSITHHTERVEQISLDLSETREGFDQTRTELDADLRKITELGTELEQLTPLLETVQQDAAVQATALEAAEQEQQQRQKEWEEFSQRAEEPRQTAEVEQARIQQLEQIIERSTNRKNNLTTEQQALATQLKAQDSDEGEGRERGEGRAEAATSGTEEKEIQQLETELANLQQQGSTATEQLEQQRNAYEALGKQQNQCRSDLQKLLGQQASLEALQQAALGEDDAEVNHWLAEQGLNKKPRLAESLSIEPGWEAAVETVLGDALRSISVKKFDNLLTSFTALSGGQLALIREGNTRTSAAKANMPPLADKVRTKLDISELLAGIYIADSLAAALQQQATLAEGESLVTRDGVWLGRSWVRVSHAKAADSTLKRKELLEEIITNINEKKKLSDELDKQSTQLQETLHQLEQQREQLQSTQQQKTWQLSELKSELGARQAKAEEAHSRITRIKQELTELEQHLQTEQVNLARARQNLQQALDIMAQDEGGRQSLLQARDASLAQVQRCREAAREVSDKAHNTAMKQQSVESQLKSTRETMDRMAVQAERAKERMTSLSTQISESDEPLEKMRSDLESLLQKRLGVEKDLNEAKGKLDANEHALRKLEQERSEIQEKLDKVRENLTELRLKSEGAVVKRQGIVEQLQESKFNLEAVLAALPEDLDETSCEQNLEKLSSRIQRLGPINLAATEEYQQQSERKIYLDQQNEDLEKALHTLRNAIRKIDKETRSRFKETFEKVNTGLQTLFPRLFGGGHAYLDMTGEDLLDTGVAIMARPPGKRNSTIHLLSGGEKAMTAIALVFSIFHLNPAPFCMLDEVDAPLDDANVSRYASLVKEMADYVQFVFITHNKITMEMAHQLLGVTMHEAGVSRIVAVDVDEAVELVES